MSHIKRPAWFPLRLASAALVILAIAFFLRLRPASRSATSEQYAVYSAYFNSEINKSNGKYGRTNSFILLIQQNSSTAHADPSRRQFVEAQAPMLEDETVASFLAQNVVSQKLERHFDLSEPYELMPEDELTRADSIDAPPAHPEYFRLSRVGFNKDLSQALFYTEHLCPLCERGGYVVMERRWGRWRVKTFLGTWMS
ncbi:MAG: hypothetical protein DMG80_04455 [Acidobacteria bacterium]|nr:MAG: hypothetical protein DMG80_04455 [Acidobacteriota bacterium]